MAWSEEDWLIIDCVLNDIAKSLRRIKREKQRQQKDIEQTPSLTDVSTTKQEQEAA